MSIKKRNKKIYKIWVFISILAVLAMIGFTVAPALLYMQ